MMDRVHALFAATAPARPVALARIIVSAAALAKAADLGPALLVLAAGEAPRMPYGLGTPAPLVTYATLLVGLWVAAGIAFLIGWRTRWAGVALTLTLTAVLVFDQQLYSNHLYLLVLLSLLLTLADSGAALSVDARRSRTRDAVPAWPVTLLKIQLTVVYGFAAVTKVNLYYLSGVVFDVYWVREGLFALPGPLRRVEVLFPLALTSVAAEAFIAVAIWSRRTRPIAYVVGLGLHLSIIPMLGLSGQFTIFAFLMFALYILFLDAEPRSRLVVWDDGCSFCRVWVRWFRRLDWLRVHRFAGSSDAMVLVRAAITPEDADTALQLVGPRRARAHGFRAVRLILERLPIAFLWAPLLGIPAVERLGERAYAGVAAHRRCATRISV